MSRSPSTRRVTGIPVQFGKWNLTHFFFGDLLSQEPSGTLPGCHVLFIHVQAMLELRQAAMSELGRAVEVVVALGVLDLMTDIFDLLPELPHLVDRLLLGLPLGSHRVGSLFQVCELFPQGGQSIAAGLVLFLFEGGFLDLEAHDPSGGFVEIGGQRIDLRPDHGACLIDEVDRLVWQESIADVAIGQYRRSDQGAVLNADAVVDLVALLEPAQDRDRVLDRRRLDQHRLKAAFESGIFLNVLSVLVERRCSYAVQLTSGQHRLEQIAGIGRALGAPRADDVVHLVDEQQDAAVTLLDLVEHCLQPLFEFAPVLRSGE